MEQSTSSYFHLIDLTSGESPEPLHVEVLVSQEEKVLPFSVGGSVRMREAPASPDGGLIADYLAPFDDPLALAARLDAVPGVVGHGIFPPALTSDVLVASGTRVEHRRLAR